MEKANVEELHHNWKLNALINWHFISRVEQLQEEMIIKMKNVSTNPNIEIKYRQYKCDHD